jgi:phospholipid/cholesterol/gamma-HCH transport system substrate-binding protein
MPRTRSLAWSELKLGVLTIVAVVIAATTIFMVTGGQGFFWQQYSLKTRFASVPGLKPGSPVRLAGVEVGSVDSVVPVDEIVEVTFQVHRRWQERITTRSVARLGSVSLLGEAAVDITPSTTGTPIPEWGYVASGRAPAQLSDITDQAGEGIQELTALLQDIRGGRGTVGQLMTDDRLYVELQRFAASANALTDGLREGRGALGRLLNDAETADALEASLKNVEALTRRISEGEGSLGRLTSDDTFARTLTATTSNLETLTQRLNRGEGTLGKFVTDDAVYNQLRSVSDRLDQLLAGLNGGDGTAGQLLKDERLYENMNVAVNEFRALLSDIREDPRQYLNVRVSIF